MVVRFRFLLLGWLLLVSNVLYGVDGEFDKDFPQIQDTASYVNLSTPYTTTLTFFLNLEERNFKPENAAKTLGGDLTPEQARKQVVKLKQIFDGQGVFVDVDNVPNEANYTDSTRSYQAKYFYDNNRLPKIFLDRKSVV